MLIKPLFFYLIFFFLLTTTPVFAAVTTGTLHIDNLGTSWNMPLQVNLEWSNFSPQFNSCGSGQSWLGFFPWPVNSAYSGVFPSSSWICNSSSTSFTYTPGSPFTNGDIAYFRLFNNDYSKSWVSQAYRYNNGIFTEMSDVAPIISNFTVASTPFQVNTNVTAAANFNDFDVSDTHTAVWNWGDGSTSSGMVSEQPDFDDAGSVSGSHTYAQAGVYTVRLTVTDTTQNGIPGTGVYQYIVVYDPSAGFFTGSGEYDSLAGWYIQDLSLSGDVKFGIHAKYKDSIVAPSGNLKIDFKNGSLAFDLTSYQWLVVNGSKAILKGTGTINGNGNYAILISAIDGTKEKASYDYMRVKITDSSNNVIYDTQPGASDTADPTTFLEKGSLKVN